MSEFLYNYLNITSITDETWSPINNRHISSFYKKLKYGMLDLAFLPALFLFFIFRILIIPPLKPITMLIVCLITFILDKDLFKKFAAKAETRLLEKY